MVVIEGYKTGGNAVNCKSTLSQLTESNPQVAVITGNVLSEINTLSRSR